MICPYCHNENKYDALSCDYCLNLLPMDEKRIKEIKSKDKIKKRNFYSKSITKLLGTIIGILILIAIVIIAWFRTRG